MVLALVLVAIFTAGDDCFPESRDCSLEDVHGEWGMVVFASMAMVMRVLAVMIGRVVGGCGGS